MALHFPPSRVPSNGAPLPPSHVRASRPCAHEYARREPREAASIRFSARASQQAACVLCGALRKPAAAPARTPRRRGSVFAHPQERFSPPLRSPASSVIDVSIPAHVPPRLHAVSLAILRRPAATPPILRAARANTTLSRR